MDGLTDTVGSRISMAEADRRTLGAGMDAETPLELDNGERLALRGTLGVETPLGGGDTAVRVSGAELASKAPDGVRVLLGAGAVWNAGPYTLEGGVSATGLGSDDSSYTGFLTLRTAF